MMFCSACESAELVDDFLDAEPELSLLASQAAIEFDNMRLGCSTEIRSAKDLAHRLRDSVAKNDSSSGSKSLIDPAAFAVLSRTLSVYPSGDPIVTIEQLVTEATKTAERLGSEQGKPDPDFVVWARDFCIALARGAAAFTRSVVDLQPSHPYRK